MTSQQNRDFIIKMTCVISSILKKWKGIILVMMVCGVGLDIYETLTYVPQYSASMTAVLKLEENTYSQLSDAVSYIKTLDYLFNDQVINNYIKDQLEIDDLNMHCNVTSVNETNVINIQVISNTKKQAFYSLKYIVEWYQNNTEEYYLSYDLDVLEEATLNEYPINSNSHTSSLKKGAMISGIISIVLIGLVSYLKNTVKTAHDIQYQIDCRLFAQIPREIKKRGIKFWKRKKTALLITSLKTSFHYKESIKKLRSKVEESAKKHGYCSIMITSTLENEGKSSIAANLALSLAKNDHKVLLIDADIRKPSIHKIFELETNRSLNAYLKGEQTWENQVDYLQQKNLFVMCATQDLEHADQLLSSQNMHQLIEKASHEFDFVIVDSSPMYGLNEPIMINEMVDASLIVIKQHVATTRMINETISRLVSAKNNVIGCIYNASVIDFMKGHKIYGYRYGYSRYTRRERRS